MPILYKRFASSDLPKWVKHAQYTPMVCVATGTNRETCGPCRTCTRTNENAAKGHFRFSCFWAASPLLKHPRPTHELLLSGSQLHRDWRCRYDHPCAKTSRVLHTDLLSTRASEYKAIRRNISYPIRNIHVISSGSCTQVSDRYTSPCAHQRLVSRDAPPEALPQCASERSQMMLRPDLDGSERS